MVTSKYVDLIDLNTIEDADLEITTDVHTKTEYVTSGCLCCTKIDEIVKTEAKECAKLFLSLNTTMASREKGENVPLNVQVIVYDIEQGTKLHTAIVAAMEEAHNVQVIKMV